jgi:hypothetical protein
LLVLELAPGELDWTTLTTCQQEALAGRHAASMAGFIRWLAPQIEDIHKRLRTELAEIREQVRGRDDHMRTPGIVADLVLGFRYLLGFAKSARAISGPEQADLWRRAWTGLVEAGVGQGAFISAGEPARFFLRLLSAAIASGQAHVANERGNEPPQPERWGWRPEEFVNRNGTGTKYVAHGLRVGWLAGGDLYLEPDASFAVAQRLARDQNESFSITALTLRRRLKEQGLLAGADDVRGKLTVRKVLQGARREVLRIAWSSPHSLNKRAHSAHSAHNLVDKM